MSVTYAIVFKFTPFPCTLVFFQAFFGVFYAMSLHNQLRHFLLLLSHIFSWRRDTSKA